MIRYEAIENSDLKSQITEYVLRRLPHWFGNEQALVDYVNTVKDKVFFAAYDHEAVIGFICLKSNNPYTADIYVTGILEEYHRQGIGREFIKLSENYLKDQGYKFFMVMTLGESSDYEYYKRTREFYKAVGFYPLEEFKQIWDEHNPCLIMVKTIH